MEVQYLTKMYIKKKKKILECIGDMNIGTNMIMNFLLPSMQYEIRKYKDSIILSV